MHGLADLKQRIECTEDTVPCPVRDCSQAVPRQHKKFSISDKFCCPDHGICISASTFVYADMWDNMLWRDTHDRQLWSNITQPGIKRESRIAYDNSEDAVSWNVLRYVETANLLNDLERGQSDRFID